MGEPTPEELIAAAEVEKSALNTAANAVMAPIQDGVDLDIATDEESKRYTEWRRYRVLLSRVNIATAPDITLPYKPE
ncbi:tail fiber assembly protein [Rosenbergiella gaditana]|uniref:tail fiber assembly protein n=1 Tax=Rosenbergiella gaditana TaxID=2726987 RepID=UPI003B82DC88